MKKNELVNVNPQDKTVYLVLNGKIVYQDHSLDDPYAFKVSMIARPGIVIGVKELDNGASCLPTIFPVV